MKAAPRKPDVIVGDEVYFHHAKGPMAGKVCAHGEHGCTVEADGKHHRVKWDKVLGHKKRAAQEYRVADEGEDGMIVEDAKGLRQFIAVPPEARSEEKMVIKSHGAAPRLALLLKGMAPRPGLTEKKITDKNGTQTTRWVQSTPDMPSPKVGHHVGFVNGEHRGHGKVASAGKDGVMVNDKAGGLHQVRHEHITHRWDSSNAPDVSPHDVDAEVAGAKKSGGALFSPDEVAKLPVKVSQPAKSWDELVTKGTEGLAQFKDAMGKIAGSMGLKSDKKPDALTPEEWASDDGYLFIAPLKGEKRAKEKVESDYGGDWSQLRDIVRGTISVPTMAHVKEAIQHMKSAGLELAQQPKDRFAKPTSEGYRDLMTFVRLPNGMLAELQVHVKSMTLAKEEGHEHYNVTRSLQAKHNEAEPSDKWPDEDHTKFYAALKAQKYIYGKAWQQATGGTAGEPLQKSMPRLIIVMSKRS